MMPVDSLLGWFLVARVVFRPLSALAFRVVVERQLFHHAAAAHVRRLQEKPAADRCYYYYHPASSNNAPSREENRGPLEKTNARSGRCRIASILIEYN